MQHYRITLNRNVREHTHQIVQAENVEAAIRKAIEADEWSSDSDCGDAEAEDPTFWATPVTAEGDETETDEDIDDEYNHPDGYAYYDDLKRFAKMLAVAVAESNGLVDDNTGALMTPESIRKTARHILKMD